MTMTATGLVTKRSSADFHDYWPQLIRFSWIVPNPNELCTSGGADIHTLISSWGFLVWWERRHILLECWMTTISQVQSVQWVGFQTAGDPMETPLFLGRRSSEMIRSALLGSPSVWITKDFKRCTRDQWHQDKITILSVDHLELLDAVLKSLEKPNISLWEF